MQMRRYIRMFLGLTALSLILLAAVAYAQAGDRRDADRPPCSDCHVCGAPTFKEPCLKQCLRELKEGTIKHVPAEGPEVAILDQLQDIYQPVRFNHKHHAEMVGMGRGCSQCHHYSPAGKMPPCVECHGRIASETQDLGKPGLKGAYHRQCMGCHREWSHSTACVVCHLPREGEDLTQDEKDRTDIVGISHPIITEPVKKIYYTPYEQGPMVTFYHMEHIELFGLRCVDCHQKENCAYCHDIQNPTNLRKTDEEIHAICSNCHGTHKCSKCHDKKERPAFSHADTGWPLNRFHIALNCRACHPTGKRISKLDSGCGVCHGGWNQENFSHGMVGLQLDEVHGELDCTECHIDRNFSAKPNCAACHDDGRDYRKSPPGTLIKMAGS